LNTLEMPDEIICYPRPSEEQRQKRLKELETIGIEKVLLRGEKKLNGYPIINKGCVSVVVLVEIDSGLAVLKIRRTDANRTDMFHEAEMLIIANRLGIGPQLRAYSENLMVMEYADGLLFADWLDRAEAGEVKRAKPAIRSLLTQCHLMDTICLDHGELHNASEHVIFRGVDRSPTIIDFESASRTRRAKNLTSICQFLFMRREILNSSRLTDEPISLGCFKERLREYKKDPSEERFQEVVATLRLED
jgi:putative serine/threonine protein kinase